ncbi:MAG TPA: hypothetical protein VIH56_09500 [Candidatus Acidoferrales bacterium]
MRNETVWLPPRCHHPWIPSPGTNLPEKAQISVAGAPRPYRDLRIENSLTDEHGYDVRLKKGAHVEITVTSRDGGHHN